MRRLDVEITVQQLLAGLTDIADSSRPAISSTAAAAHASRSSIGTHALP